MVCTGCKSIRIELFCGWMHWALSNFTTTRRMGISRERGMSLNCSRSAQGWAFLGWALNEMSCKILDAVLTADERVWKQFLQLARGFGCSFLLLGRCCCETSHKVGMVCKFKDIQGYQCICRFIHWWVQGGCEKFEPGSQVIIGYKKGGQSAAPGLFARCHQLRMRCCPALAATTPTTGGAMLFPRLRLPLPTLPPTLPRR